VTNMITTTNTRTRTKMAEKEEEEDIPRKVAEVVV